MTEDEIEAELKRLGPTTPEFNERGELCATIALGLARSDEPAIQWLAGQWITSFANLPRIARDGIERQYDLVLHIFGLGHAMDRCHFPDSGLFLAHAKEIRATFETIAMLESMLINLRLGNGNESVH